MTATELDKWVAENGAKDHQNFSRNGIDWVFYTLPDGWIAVFEYDEGEYLPRIQAADMAHARSWCVMRERLTVPVTQIC